MLAAASTYQSNIFNSHFRSHSDTTNYKSHSFHNMASNQPKYRKSTSADILMNRNKSIIASVSKGRFNSEISKHAPSSSFPSTLNSSSSSAASVEFSDLFLLPSKKRLLEDDDEVAESETASDNGESISFPKFKKAKTAPSSPADLAEAPMTPPPTSTSGVSSSPLYTLKPMASSSSAVVSLDNEVNASTTSLISLPAAQASGSRIQSQEPHTPPSSCNSSPISSPLESVKPKLIKSALVLDYTHSLSFPDTCYSFLSVQSSKLSNERNAPISDLQNDEWREFYTSSLKKNDVDLHRRYKEYANNQAKVTKEKYTLKKPTLSSISSSSSPVARNSNFSTASPNSRITKFIETQYSKFNQSITNFPYRNNYTYLSTGYKNDIELLTSSPDLYKRQSIPRDYSRPVYPSQHVPSPQITNPYNYSLAIDHPTTPTLTTAATATYHRATAIQSPSSSFNSNKHSANITPPSSPPTRHVISTPKGQSSTSHRLAMSTTTPLEVKNITLTPTAFSSGQNKSSAPSSPTVNKFVQSSINGPLRSCISCHASQSPCWRPSWSSTEGQLCNSCGLRYKKTGARCLNEKCLRIPAKGEWTLMKGKGKVNCHVYNSEGQVISNRMSYRCLHCDGEVELQTGRD